MEKKGFSTGILYHGSCFANNRGCEHLILTGKISAPDLTAIDAAPGLKFSGCPGTLRVPSGNNSRLAPDLRRITQVSSNLPGSSLVIYLADDTTPCINGFLITALLITQSAIGKIETRKTTSIKVGWFAIIS